MKLKVKTTIKKHVVTAIVSVVVLVSVVTVLPVVSGATITVPDDYPTIQQAVNAAHAGDTVYIRSGTYYEHVVIDKSLILQGETRDTTIVNGSGSGYVIHLRADNVFIQQLTVTNGNRGIFLDHADNCEIDDVIANYCAEGMTFVYSTYNIVENTIVAHNNPLGINTGDRGSHHNTFQNIEAYSNIGSAIMGYAGSHYTKILDSHLYDNNSGVTIGWSSYWSIENTVIHSNGSSGILIDTASNGTVENCEIYSNRYGVDFMGLGSYYNIVVNNRIHSNVCGLYVGARSQHNTAKENVIYNNGYGVWIRRNDLNLNHSNVLYHNDFINNTVNAQVDEDRYANTWDNGYPSGGNYWSDYAGVDVYRGAAQNTPGSDGIGDIPYVMNVKNRDNYPLMTPVKGLPQEIHTSNSDKVVLFDQIIRPLALFNINTAKSQLKKAFELSEELKTNTVPTEVKEKIGMAAEYIEKAEMYYNGRNYIAANYWANQALALLKEAIEIIEAQG
jgi:parallel beta-helix repeat protein